MSTYDTDLQRAVMAELNWEPGVSAAHIGVTAKNGVVTLSGHVESFLERLAAENAASRVKGVKGIAEEIEVRLPFDIKRSDDDIAGAALDRLSWNASLPKDAIKVKVEKGIVTLDRARRVALPVRLRRVRHPQPLRRRCGVQ